MTKFDLNLFLSDYKNSESRFNIFISSCSLYLTPVTDSDFRETYNMLESHAKPQRTQRKPFGIAGANVCVCLWLIVAKSSIAFRCREIQSVHSLREGVLPQASRFLFAVLSTANKKSFLCDSLRS